MHLINFGLYCVYILFKVSSSIVLFCFVFFCFGERIWNFMRFMRNIQNGGSSVDGF